MRRPAVLLAPALLAGCAAPELPLAGAGACDAAKAQGFVGRSATPDLAEAARRASGARVVRTLTPDMIVTMEFRADRLDLTIGTDGTIGSIRCG